MKKLLILILSLVMVVFYRSNGQQQTRSKAASVKNPRTMAQSTQRVLMKNVVLAYSALKSICDHSFQNVQYGAPSQRKFMRDNLDKMRTVAAATNGGWERMPGLVPVGGSGFPGFEFLVSQGSLPTMPVSVDNSYIYMPGAGIVGQGTVTYQQFCDKVGLQRGDQITFIAVYGNADNYEVKMARVILDPYVDGQPASMDTEFLLAGPSLGGVNPENQGYIRCISPALTAGPAFVLKDMAQPTDLLAGVVIASRKNGSSWLRSEQNLVISNNGIQVGNTLGNNAAQASAGTLTIDVDNPYYLNGAEQAAGNNANYDAYAIIGEILAGGNLDNRVASSGTTHVELSGGKMYVKVTSAFSQNKKAAYKIGSGSWTVITGSFTDNVLQGSFDADEDDVISIAVGRMDGSTFVPESIWGGTITADGETINP